MIWLSSDLRFKWCWLSIDLRFNWFGCQLVWDSNDLVVNRCVLQMILVVCWFELQVMWLSIDLRFKWFGCQLIWDSSDVVVNRFEIQMSWLSIDLRFKWFGCQMIWGSSGLVVNWCVIQMVLSNEAFLRDFLQKDALKLKNEAFVRDFLQNWSFEIQKRSISAKLPSKTKLWRSKMKLFCETSFKIEALKLKNEAFLRDFLQNWSFEDQKRSISARLPSKKKLWLKNEAFVRDFLQKWNFLRDVLKIDMSTGHLTSEFQYVLTIFKWMLQKYCACHEKVAPRHTKSCNCHAKWSLQSNTSVAWNLQPSTDSESEASNMDIAKHEILGPATRNESFRSRFKSTTPANVFATLTKSCACHVFCNVSKSLRLPRKTHFQPPKTFRDRQFLTILTSKPFWRAGVVQILQSSTSKSAPSMPRFNGFDFQIGLARRRCANFAKLNFQKCSGPISF